MHQPPTILSPPHSLTDGRAPHLLNAQESRRHVGLHHRCRRPLASLGLFNALISHALSLCFLDFLFFAIVAVVKASQSLRAFLFFSCYKGKKQSKQIKQNTISFFIPIHHFHCLLSRLNKHNKGLPYEKGTIFNNYKDRNLISDCMVLEEINPVVPDQKRFYRTHRLGVTLHWVSKVCLGSSSDVGVASLWGSSDPEQILNANGNEMSSRKVILN